MLPDCLYVVSGWQIDENKNVIAYIQIIFCNPLGDYLGVMGKNLWVFVRKQDF